MKLEFTEEDLRDVFIAGQNLIITRLERKAKKMLFDDVVQSSDYDLNGLMKQTEEKLFQNILRDKRT